MIVNQLSVDQLSVDQLSVDQLSVDQLSVDQLSVDQLSVDQLWWYFFCLWAIFGQNWALFFKKRLVTLQQSHLCLFTCEGLERTRTNGSFIKALNFLTSLRLCSFQRLAPLKI
jgi:hypothetical protein